MKETAPKGGLSGLLEAYQRRDPAARSKLEVFLLYQGVHAVIFHRVSHWLWRHNCRFLARLNSQIARHCTGIEIHPGATIGKRLVIDQGKRHPTIGNNVLISAGAKVLGPFRVGDNSRIAANAVVLSEVPADATAVGIPAQIVRIAGQSTRFADEVDQTSVKDPRSEELQALSQRLELVEKLLDQEYLAKIAPETGKNTEDSNKKGSDGHVSL